MNSPSNVGNAVYCLYSYLFNKLYSYWNLVYKMWIPFKKKNKKKPTNAEIEKQEGISIPRFKCEDEGLPPPSQILPFLYLGSALDMTYLILIYLSFFLSFFLSLSLFLSFFLSSLPSSLPFLICLSLI